ncbi:MAG: prenyltransferase [Rhodospirillaceae bacterium]|jgi:1,4-dihydroxy-2-naphthoate polyprenyltransferase|nr:prenyltransferase [Rhodospirillaceae bacterium]
MEPSIAALGGRSPGRVIKRYLLATRPKFLTASVLPVLLGTAAGFAMTGSVNAEVFVLALAATVFVHAGANVINDVFDETTGNDGINEGRIYPFTGGSRFIQNGVLDVGQMTRWALLLLAMGAVAGIGLAAVKGLMVIGFGLVGIGLGVLYSAPPVRLSGRGLGEVAVGIAFGVLPVMGAAWLQSGALTIGLFLLSLPVGLWVTSILVINEVPDIDADGQSGRRTLIVQLGTQGGRLLYIALQLAALAATVAAAYVGMVPLWAAIVPALIAGGAFVAGGGIVDPGEDAVRLRKSIEMTLASHAIGTLWLVIAVATKGL